ncbi:MAG TPA: hypothetical protein VHW66_07675 [Stellaceae bacterium]|jgi:hypothetical protein|nr:hypothetical protein [Stellaceae bacterium]
MNQVTEDRIKAAFSGFQAAQREAEASVQRLREVRAVKRREFEEMIDNIILPALENVANTIRALGYPADAKRSDRVYGPSCSLQFHVIFPPIPEYLTPFEFVVEWGFKDCVSMISSNERNIHFESRVENVPEVGTITSEWIEKNAANFVERVLSEQSRKRAQ